MLSHSRAAPLLLALSALTAAGLARAWSDDDLLLPPVNSTARFLANLEVDVAYARGSSTSAASSTTSSSSSSSTTGSTATSSGACNVSVERLPARLVARWDGAVGFRCDVLVYTTNNHGKAFFSAAFSRAVSPVFIEHVGLAGGQQELRLCVGCGGAGGARQHRRPGAVRFCCLDFALDELKGDRSWRLNRKPIESTLVACFMTLVIIVWSVAALIWPVPIIAGFLPNGMEQRRPR
ncbi:hypothetical protein NFI96_009476 [Prochilodus magdalenae]|nr:hypothetical protein NFI96_009476 [Prochilodus magdalenae]